MKFAISATRWLITIHAVFESVTVASHTVKVQWISYASLDVSFYNRRLTVLVGA